MDGPSVDGEGGLLYRLVERRLGMRRARVVLCRRAILHGERRLGDHRAGIRPDDMDTEYAVRLGVGEDLDEAVSVCVGARAASRREGEFSGLVDDPGGLQLLLGLADRSDLGPRVDARRDGA